ncbi:hypothetical protein NKR23_g12561, partial [Pleurostoma richardsiae]
HARLEGVPGQERYLFLAANSPTLRSKTEGWVDSVACDVCEDGADSVEFPCALASIYMDEAHLIKGHDSIPWTWLRNRFNITAQQLTLTALSATPLEKGPEDIRCLTEILNNPVRGWLRRSRPPAVPASSSCEVLQELKATHASLVSKARALLEEKAARGPWTQHDRARAYRDKLATFLEPFTLRRRRDDTLGGKPICHQRDPRIAEKSLGVPAKYVRPLTTLMETTVDRLDDELRKKIRSWEHGGRVGPRPTIDTILSGQHNIPGKFQLMRLASTFPAVSVLGAAQGGPTFETAQIERAFRTECSLLEAQRSPYWGIIDQLCDNSPKIRFLDEMLQEMKADRSPFRGYDYGVEDQQIFRKKAVVYAEKPVTAHLLVLHLWKKFPELNPTIITAGQSRAVKDSRAVW